jgi:hypothetical protein
MRSSIVATTIRNPWTVEQTVVPAIDSLADVFRWAVSHAILAPSGHNTQPWRFRIQDDVIELYADRTRSLSVVDPDDRELTIACGAALLNLRLALDHAGIFHEVDLLPEGSDSDLLARVRVLSLFPPPAEADALFAAIPHRRTNRQPFDLRPLPNDLIAALAADVVTEGAWLRVVTGDTQVSVAGLIAEGDAIQWEDKHFRNELASWLHPLRTGDGMHAFYRHGLGPLVVRHFDLGRDMGRKDRELADAALVLAILGTDGDTPLDWLHAGQSLARLLLRARAGGADASYFNQPVQEPELRPRLAAAIGVTGFPQLVFRLGYGPAVEAAPRRPVADVLIANERFEPSTAAVS